MKGCLLWLELSLASAQYECDIRGSIQSFLKSQYAGLVGSHNRVELGKLVLEQVLDLGKPVLEGYVQDFFKDCLSSGVSRLNATALKTPMAEAVGYFIKRFIKELQLNNEQTVREALPPMRYDLPLDSHEMHNEVPFVKLDLVLQGMCNLRKR